MRQEDWAALVWFVNSRVQVLDHFIAAADPDSTAHFVANEERAAWQKVSGGGDPPSENIYYVLLDRTRFKEVYGFYPLEHGHR